MSISQLFTDNNFELRAYSVTQTRDLCSVRTAVNASASIILDGTPETTLLAIPDMITPQESTVEVSFSCAVLFENYANVIPGGIVFKIKYDGVTIGQVAWSFPTISAAMNAEFPIYVRGIHTKAAGSHSYTVTWSDPLNVGAQDYKITISERTMVARVLKWD